MTIDFTVNLNSILLLMANIIGGLVIADIKDLKSFIRATRKKLDEHTENFSMHGLVRPSHSAPRIPTI